MKSEKKADREQAGPIVVGIGASAGGLEALQDFFKNLPVHTGLAFVVIQHLSPDYRSLMDELLARETSIPISIASDGLDIQPDHIYLIPPRKNLTIFHDKLYLEDQEPRKRLNLPVDIFFRSLAVEKGKQAIGIILSGTGSDGTLGTRAIKEAGGMVMVQDEASAKFDGMPRSSISTGLVDYILPADRMPGELVAFVKHPLVKQKKNLDDDLSENLDTLTKITLILRDHGGIDFSYYKHNTLARRLERRVSINRLQTLEEYMSFLRESEKEKDILQRELLIGVTRFFRDGEAFEALRKKVFQQLAGKKMIRVWTAGCSTGEEAYTLAIMLSEFRESAGSLTDIKIFATDIDRSAIEYAGKGFYPDSVVADIDPALLMKYFIKKENGYMVNDSIRKMIVFAKHNILKDSPFGHIDLLSCRNLFIYLKPEVQARVLSSFYYSLAPDGFLLLGSSETIGELAEGFDCLDTKWKIFRFKAGYKASAQNLIVAAPERGSNDHLLAASRPATGRERGIRIDRIMDALLSRFVSPSILIDSADDIVHVINDVSPYVKIRPGRFSHNLLDNMDGELSLYVSMLLRRLKRGDTDSAVESLEPLGHIDTRIEGWRIEIEQELYYLLSFSQVVQQGQSGSAATGSDSATSAPAETAEDLNRVQTLERELQFTKENLQATVEELESSNEELQSSNEELIASNEELQSTNEELQSVNEELYTVNTEYQAKIEELTRLNNDVSNLLKNTDVGALYLDRSLCIRRLTPIVSRLTNIMETDIGRPIYHLSLGEGFEQLLSSIQDVVETLQPKDQQVELSTHGSYLVKVRPYRTDYNSVDGVVVVFIDVSELQKENQRADQASLRLEQELENKVQLLERILENSPIANTMVSAEGQLIYANRSACALLGISKNDGQTRTFDASEWKISGLTGQPIPAVELPFSRIKASLQPVEDYRHYIERPGTGKRLLQIRGTPLLSWDGSFEGAVFALEELAD